MKAHYMGSRIPDSLFVTQIRALVPMVQRICKALGFEIQELQAHGKLGSLAKYHKPAYELRLVITLENWKGYLRD